MAKTFGGFRAALLAGWMVLGVAGIVFARAKGIPLAAALPVIAAFLAEYPFYLVAAFPAERQRLANIGVMYRGRMARALPAILSGSLVLPYLLCTLGGIPFDWLALVRLVSLGLAISLWYVILPAIAPLDAAFLGAGRLGHARSLFRYHLPALLRSTPGGARLGRSAARDRVDLDAATARSAKPAGASGRTAANGPSARGTTCYSCCWADRWQWRSGPRIWPSHAAHWWIVAAIFFGSLWVSSLAEEFLFRGVLQQWVEDWTGNARVALLLTSVVFGLAHLWFRGFPNWRWVPVAAVLGWICGRARNQAGSIRASVVTHALVVATWRAFFA